MFTQVLLTKITITHPCMGEAMTYRGDLGSCAVVKLVNNYIPAVSNLVMAGVSCKTPMSKGSVSEFYNLASAAGYGEDDWTTGVYRAMKSLSKNKLL